jgi:hypothetical protein
VAAPVVPLRLWKLATLFLLRLFARVPARRS